VNFFVSEHISVHVRWEMSIKMDLKELEFENVEWIYVYKVRVQRCDVETHLYEIW
jgi:hypothetical protein